MKLAYPLTYLMGKSLDMVLLSIFAFVRPSRPKTALHKINNCYLTLAIAYDVFGVKEFRRSRIWGNL